MVAGTILASALLRDVPRITGEFTTGLTILTKGAILVIQLGLPWLAIALFALGSALLWFNAGQRTGSLLVSIQDRLTRMADRLGA